MGNYVIATQKIAGKHLSCLRKSRAFYVEADVSLKLLAISPFQAVYSRDSSPNVISGHSHVLSECVNNFQAGLEEVSFTAARGMPQ